MSTILVIIVITVIFLCTKDEIHAKIHFCRVDVRISVEISTSCPILIHRINFNCFKTSWLWTYENLDFTGFE